jgi:hypothetical protein
MTRRIRSFRPSPSIVISCLALFMALTGTAFALGKNTVRSPQIVDGTVRAIDLADNSVTSPKIAPEAVSTQKLAADSVDSTKIAENAVGTSEVAPETLSQLDLANDSVGSTELQTSAVRASELGTIIQVTNSTKIASGGDASVGATCPGGTKVISGGGQPGFYKVAMTSSFRDNNNGWIVQAHSYAGSETNLNVFAYCLTGGSSN